MPPVVACLHHLEQPFTGHAGRVLRAAGIALDERDGLRGDPLPALAEVDGIVSFGGDGSVLDLDKEPALRAEAALLREAALAGVPVLGLCLGGQLLAHALGGAVRRMPRRTIAWLEVERLPAAAGDPVAAALPARFPVLHWNEDGFEPPPGATELLSRPTGSAEAFVWGGCAWGLQCHPEVDAEALDGWYAAEATWLAQAGVDERAARAADARWLPVQEGIAAALFGAFADVVRPCARARATAAR